MKILKIELLILLGLFLIASTVACIDEEVPTPPQDPDPINLDISGVQMTDQNGQPIGCYGECGDDWTDTALTVDELSLISTVGNLPNASPTLGTVQMYPIYPNPIGNMGNMGISFETSGILVFKMVIVDTMGNIYVTHASETQDGFNTIQISDEVLEGLERKTIYRIYYGFYDVTDAPIHTGYGDFGICEENFNPNPQACFE